MVEPKLLNGCFGTGLDGFERIVDRTELSEQDGEKLAEDMRQILENLSPVIDEIVTYEPKKNQQ